MITKELDQELHDASDPKSKLVAIKFFAKYNIKLEQYYNKFEKCIDLISSDGVHLVEVEHRLVWESREFPFATVNIPERKYKLANGKSHYCIVNYFFDRIGIISAKKVCKFISKENLVLVPNKFGDKEKFYKVPKENFKFFKV